MCGDYDDDDDDDYDDDDDDDDDEEEEEEEDDEDGGDDDYFDVTMTMTMTMTMVGLLSEVDQGYDANHRQVQICSGCWASWLAYCRILLRFFCRPLPGPCPIQGLMGT